MDSMLALRTRKRRSDGLVVVAMIAQSSTSDYYPVQRMRELLQRFLARRPALEKARAGMARK